MSILSLPNDDVLESDLLAGLSIDIGMANFVREVSDNLQRDGSQLHGSDAELLSGCFPKLDGRVPTFHYRCVGRKETCVRCVNLFGGTAGLALIEGLYESAIHLIDAASYLFMSPP